jgi:hypothetical protein
MVKDLHNVLKINGEDYNINAVYSDRAGSADTAAKCTGTAESANTAAVADTAAIANEVKYALHIKEAGTETCSFNGSEDITIDIVPATGGVFSGPIRVPANEDESLPDEAVLNYKDIVNKVLYQLINNSTTYVWDGDELSPTSANGAINGLSLITGSFSALEAFIDYNKNTASTKINAYLYICTDNGNIYYNTINSDTAVPVAINATNLCSTTKDGTDYTADSLQKILSDITTDILQIKNGGIAVKKAESAESAGTATLLGGYKAGYFQKRILTGTADPNSSTADDVVNALVGDIYIRYS